MSTQFKQVARRQAMETNSFQEQRSRFLSAAFDGRSRHTLPSKVRPFASHEIVTRNVVFEPSQDNVTLTLVILTGLIGREAQETVQALTIKVTCK